MLCIKAVVIIILQDNGFTLTHINALKFYLQYHITHITDMIIFNLTCNTYLIPSKHLKVRRKYCCISKSLYNFVLCTLLCI